LNYLLNCLEKQIFQLRITTCNTPTIQIFEQYADPVIMKDRIELIRDLILECISTNNLEVIVELIHKLEIEYNEIANLATLGEYDVSWGHLKTIDYITKET
jgi:hypothetical protein